MKKRIITLLLALVLAASAFCMTAAAVTPDQNQAANALNSLGLFLGTGKGYALESQLTRDQGITLLVRMLGKEDEAKKGSFQHPFTDMTEWAKPYVSYAYANKLTKGVSATKFKGSAAMSKQMFVTITLRALGYSDAKDGDFAYNEAIAFAKKVGLIASTNTAAAFSRGEAVEIFWAALNLNLNGTQQTLAAKLIADGVFSKADFEKATEIRKTEKISTHTATVEIDPNLQKPDQNKTDGSGSLKLSWSAYQNMSASEKTAFFNSFATAAEFNAWRKAAQDAEKTDAVIIDQGTVITFN